MRVLQPKTLPVVDVGQRALYASGQYAHIFCVVDELADYAWASQWKWKVAGSKRCGKLYFVRTTRWMGRHVAIWLHKEICLRELGLPPNSDQTIADHLNGDSLVNMRGNFRWATQAENDQNRSGVAAQQLRMAINTRDPSRPIGARFSAKREKTCKPGEWLPWSIGDAPMTIGATPK